MGMQGKTVIITGASRGIGAAAARIFASAGANVALLARSKAALEDLVASMGGSALAVSCDVARFEDVAAAVEQTVSAFGGVDVLINNAAVIDPMVRLADVDPEAWGGVIDINAKGVFHGMRAVLPVMKAAGGGSVLTISSDAAHRPLEAWSAYCTSKAAARMLNLSLHQEEAKNGIRAICLSPGTVMTPMLDEVKASGINLGGEFDLVDQVPPEWPARALLWMCNPAADRFKGSEVALSDPDIRQEIGLI
jgi:NAD(P)-dependent dehydrogenase (short-subunit alcohol dehydrogenase family)